ncbi:MAG TPA: hypothetical protein PK156_33260 [Polyangium sp.]|nr:hypothetical protein [Polyangium sp.]
MMRRDKRILRNAQPAADVHKSAMEAAMVCPGAAVRLGETT